ncbi:DUF5658 family protein [Candidatus Poribacteria bacterium]
MIHPKIERFGSIQCRWFQIMAASLAYIVAHVFDYLFTVHGIAVNAAQEANPVVQGYMDCFGVGKGLVICKSLMSIIIIFGVIVTHLAYTKRGNKIRVEYILYAGALLTFLGGALWLTKL